MYDGIANANSVVEEEDQFIAEETSELVTKQQKEYQVHVIDNAWPTYNVHPVGTKRLPIVIRNVLDVFRLRSWILVRL